MKNNNIFSKIKNFFKNLFNNKKKLPTAEYIESKENIVEDNESTKLNKEQFLDLYERLKQGDVDIFTIDPDEVEKMCMLLEEEIKLKEKQLDGKLSKIAELDESIRELKAAM